MNKLFDEITYNVMEKNIFSKESVFRRGGCSDAKEKARIKRNQKKYNGPEFTTKNEPFHMKYVETWEEARKVVHSVIILENNICIEMNQSAFVEAVQLAGISQNGVFNGEFVWGKIDGKTVPISTYSKFYELSTKKPVENPIPGGIYQIEKNYYINLGPGVTLNKNNNPVSRTAVLWISSDLNYSKLITKLKELNEIYNKLEEVEFDENKANSILASLDYNNYYTRGDSYHIKNFMLKTNPKFYEPIEKIHLGIPKEYELNDDFVKKIKTVFEIQKNYAMNFNEVSSYISETEFQTKKTIYLFGFNGPKKLNHNWEQLSAKRNNSSEFKAIQT